MNVTKWPLSIAPAGIVAVLAAIIIFDAWSGLLLSPVYADQPADPYEKGLRLYNAKQDQAAIEYFNQTITAHPRHAEAFVGRGMARYALREYTPAIEDFSTAIQLKPDYEEAYIYRGKAYRALRQPERALADFTTATQVNPASGKGSFERANTYQMFYPNQPATALKNLDEAIRREPKNAFYYNRRGGCCLRPTTSSEPSPTLTRRSRSMRL